MLRDVGPHVATATSAIELMRTRHLQRRKAERGIDTRALQAAIKHGTKAPGNRPNTVMHAHNDLRVVTRGKQRDCVGITAYRAARKAPPVPKFIWRNTSHVLAKL